MSVIIIIFTSNYAICFRYISPSQPAYGHAFSAATRGHLVCKEGGAWQRCWCVLDGSTLLCYQHEEVRRGGGRGLVSADWMIVGLFLVPGKGL